MWQFILTDLTPGSQNLGVITIDEPIGWDKAVLSLKRDTKWHGIFTDYSSSLKFPGTGFNMIKSAWQTYGTEAQILADIYYACSDTDTPEIVYSGMLNFNNPEFQEGSTCLATINIEPFSDLMAFKNRQNVVVDLDNGLSADQSVSLAPYLALGSGSTQFQLNYNSVSGDYYLSYQYTYNVQDVLDWLNSGYGITNYTWELFFGFIVPICTNYSGGDTIGSVYNLNGYSTVINYLDYTISSGSFPVGGVTTTVYYMQVSSFLPDQTYILAEFNKANNYAMYGAWVQYTPIPSCISIAGTPWGASLSGFPASGSLGSGFGMPLTLVPKGILLTDFITLQVIQPNQSQGDFYDGNFTAGGTKGMEQKFWGQAQEPAGGPGSLSAALEGFIATSPGHFNNGSGTVPFFFANPLPVPQPYNFVTQVSELEIDVWNATDANLSGSCNNPGSNAFQNVQIMLILEGQSASHNLFKITVQGDHSQGSVKLEDDTFGTSIKYPSGFTCLNFAAYSAGPYSVKLTIENGTLTVSMNNGAQSVSFTTANGEFSGNYSFASVLNPTDAYSLYYETYITDNISVGFGGSEPYYFDVFLTSMQMTCNVSTTYHAYPSTTAPVYLLNEAFSRVTESITNNQMRCISNYFGRTDSQPYAMAADGAGALECITTGKKIRNVSYTVDNSQSPSLLQITNMPVSFQDLFDGMNAIHNIGIGYEADTNRPGYNRIRVEPMEYFYDTVSAPALVLDKIMDVNISLKLDDMFSSLKTGYQKFEAERYTGLDEFAGTMRYTTQLKNSSQQEMDITCKFIASGYCIEITRQQQWDAGTLQDWRLDNDVFVICLTRSEICTESGSGVYWDTDPGRYIVDPCADTSNVYRTIVLNKFHLTVELGSGGSSNLQDPDTIYNARISPARNLLRWLKKLLAAYGTSTITGSGFKSFVYAAGQANFVAKTQISNDIYLGTNYLNENINFDTAIINTGNPQFLPIMQPVTIEFDYPLGANDFSSIRSNPYKMISIRWGQNANFINCFISEVQWKAVDGMAKWIVIPVWGQNL